MKKKLMGLLSLLFSFPLIANAGEQKTVKEENIENSIYDIYDRSDENKPQYFFAKTWGNQKVDVEKYHADLALDGVYFNGRKERYSVGVGFVRSQKIDLNPVKTRWASMGPINSFIINLPGYNLTEQEHRQYYIGFFEMRYRPLEYTLNPKYADNLQIEGAVETGLGIAGTVLHRWKNYTIEIDNQDKKSITNPAEYMFARGSPYALTSMLIKIGIIRVQGDVQLETRGHKDIGKRNFTYSPRSLISVGVEL